jgi:prepilin-type N-terminal cleavage/methylation domain-containing protein
MRIKAYTLIEMLVVMVLSVIVVGIAYLVYTQTHLFQQEFEKKTHDAEELLTLDQHLRFDTQHADDITAEGSAFTLTAQNPIVIARYQSNPSGIQRTANGQSEMFNLTLQNINIEIIDHSKILQLELGPSPAHLDTLRYHITLPASAKIPLPQ